MKKKKLKKEIIKLSEENDKLRIALENVRSCIPKPLLMLRGNFNSKGYCPVCKSDLKSGFSKKGCIQPECKNYYKHYD